jgi:2-polyprenyl-3-methyl-5-hydroxy-6-metoxy-1,4-benzoquinol methylase
MGNFRTDKDQFILERCRGQRVLDIGCVNHTLEATRLPDWRHAQISKVASSVVGLDYEKDTVAQLVAQGWTIVAGDAQHFDLSANYPQGFTRIVASELIEHLVDPGSFLRCVRNHLAPGGELILSTPHAYGFAFFLEILLFGPGGDQRRPHRHLLP